MAALTTPTLIQPNEVVNGGVFKATPLNARFDVTILAPHIQEAENIHVVPVLGSAFYAALIAAKAGAISNYNPAAGALAKAFPDSDDLSVAFEALWVGGLMRLCAWAVYYEALPFIALQAGSNGVFQVNTEFAQNVGASGVKLLQDTALRRINRQAESLGVYLCANAASLTGYDNSGCPDADGCADSDDPNLIGNYGLHYVTGD